MPLVNLSESTINKIKTAGEDIKEVDKTLGDWVVSSEHSMIMQHGEPVGIGRAYPYPGRNSEPQTPEPDPQTDPPTPAGPLTDLPSQVLEYEKPSFHWIPTSGKSAGGICNTVGVNHKGLCSVTVNVVNTSHKYVIAKRGGEGADFEVTSAVFGQYPLISYASKPVHGEGGSGSTGKQAGLIQLGTLCGPPLLKIVGDGGSGLTTVVYCDALGTPEVDCEPMEIYIP